MTVPSEFPNIHIHIGERITGSVAFSPEEIATFARLSGDRNPLHYDEQYAAQTRFGSIIVSGPQLTSLMMGLTATYFSQETAMLGLEFTFHFRKAVKAGEIVHMAWEIVSAEPKASLQGVLVDLNGSAIVSDQIVLTGKGKVLVLEKL